MLTKCEVSKFQANLRAALQLTFVLLLLAVPFTTTHGDDAATADALKPHPDALANTHPPGEVDKPEWVPFIVKDRKSLPGIVVDEMDAVLQGTWQYSTHTPPYVGIGYLHDQKSGKGEKSVTYTPVLPADGVYEVRLSHCYNVRRSTNTPVTIHHADGEKTVRIDQQQIPQHDASVSFARKISFPGGQARLGADLKRWHRRQIRDRRRGAVYSGRIRRLESNRFRSEQIGGALDARIT